MDVAKASTSAWTSVSTVSMPSPVSPTFVTFLDNRRLLSFREGLHHSRSVP